MERWYEIRIITKVRLGTEDLEEESKKRQEIIRSLIMPAVKEFEIIEYHFFNYFDIRTDSHIKFRFYTDDGVRKEIEQRLESFKTRGKVYDYKTGDYNPKKDAEERVLEGAPRRIREQVIPQILKAGRWTVVPEKPEEKIERFERILRRVVGRCATAFIEEFKEKPRDSWLISVFIHLLLNSIGYSLKEENEIRAYAAI